MHTPVKIVCEMREPLSRSGVFTLNAVSAVAHTLPIYQQTMNEAELEEILTSLSAALKVYYKPNTTLSALEISLKSLLMVLHSQVAEQLQQLRNDPKNMGTSAAIGRNWPM